MSRDEARPASSKSAPYSVWVTPGEQATDDGSIWLGTTNFTHQIGKGTDVDQIPQAESSGKMLLSWFSQGSDLATIVGLDADGDVFERLTTNTGAPSALSTSEGVYYQNVKEVVLSDSGVITRRYELPDIKLDPVASKRAAGYKGPEPIVSAGHVSALVRTATSLLAFSFTGAGAGVTNLTSGQTGQIEGVGDLGPATLGPDGQLYVIGWNRNDSESTARVFVIDPSNLKVVSSLDTAVPIADMRQIDVTSGKSSTGIFLFHGDEKALHSSVFTIVGTTLTALKPLADNIGIDAVSAGDDAAYIFGGPAMNKVSRIDLNTGAIINDVPELDSPAGTYVIAVGGGSTNS